MLRTLASATRRTVLVGSKQAPAASSGLRFFHSSKPVSFSTSKKEEEPLGPSIVEKFQLDDPTRFVPLTVAGFTASWATGLYHFDMESQLLALWVLFCGTIYSQGGPAIASMFDEMSAEIKAEHAKIEQAEIDTVKAALEAHQRQTAVFEDIKNVFAAQNTLLDQLIGSSKNRLTQMLNEGAQQRLDILVNTESAVTQQVSSALLGKATSSVEAAYGENGDAALKSNALEAAIAALSNPEGAKQDPTVGNLYSKYFTGYETRRKAMEGKEFELNDAQYADLKEQAEGLARRLDYDHPVEIEKKFKVEF